MDFGNCYVGARCLGVNLEMAIGLLARLGDHVNGSDLSINCAT